MSDVQKRGIIPGIISSGKIISTSQTISILIIKLKRPKVKILKGKVIIFKIGLMKKLIKPKITPAKTNVCQGPINSTPGTYLWAKKIPKIPATICKNKDHISFNLIKILRRGQYPLIYDDIFWQNDGLRLLVVK